MLARLYWYGGIRAVALAWLTRVRRAGILPQWRDHLRHACHGTCAHRVDLHRVLRTNYLIDAYQKTYFVLDDIEQLFDSVLDAVRTCSSRPINRFTNPTRDRPPTSPPRRFLDSLA